MGFLHSLGYEPHYISPSSETIGRWAIVRLLPGVAFFRSYKVRGTIRLGKLLFSTRPAVYVRAAMAVASRLARKCGISLPEGKPAPYTVALPLSEADRNFLREVVCRPGDIIVLDYAFLTAALDHLGGERVPSLLVMHDLFSARSAQFARINRPDAVAEMSLKDELAMLAKADLIIAIQRDEAELVARHLPDHCIAVVPMAIEAARSEHVGEDNAVLFVGSMAGPNVDGLRWFLAEVWPKIRERRADARLDVVGSVCHHITPQGNAVSLHGVVSDLAPYYVRAGVVVSPLRVGSGLKIKLVEAMAWGKAIVASTVTLQGVQKIAADAVMTHDDARGFADSVCVLMSDTSRRQLLAKRALEVARRHFGAESSYAPIRAFLQSSLTVKKS